MTGSRLKFDPKAPDKGLYFVADDGGDTKVPTVQCGIPARRV